MPVNPGYRFLSEPQLEQTQPAIRFLDFLNQPEPTPMPTPVPTRQPASIPTPRPTAAPTYPEASHGFGDFRMLESPPVRQNVTRSEPTPRPTPSEPILEMWYPEAKQGFGDFRVAENQQLATRPGVSEIQSPLSEIQPAYQPAPQPERQPLDVQNFEELPEAKTTFWKKGIESGWDPRNLYAAMAQFSGEFGNIKGTPTDSSAPEYLKTMLGHEAQQRKSDLDLKEMEMKYGPKAADPEKLLKMELIKNQTEALRNKIQVDREMADPESTRSKALKNALEIYMQKSLGAPGWKADPAMTGTDVYKWLGTLQFAIGQQNLQKRQYTDAELKFIDDEERRDFEERQKELDRQAAMQRLQAGAQNQVQLKKTVPGAAPKAAKPGQPVSTEPVVQVPGWEKTENVPAREVEVSAFRRRTAAVPRVIEKINQLKSLINKYGPFENEYSEAGQKMVSISNDIKLDLKGPEFKALGVLAGPDMAILEALVPDTTSLKNAAKSPRAVNNSLDMLVQNLQKDLDASGASIGFSRARQQQPAQQPQQTGPRGRPLWKP